jgi:hypothetical protein
MAWQPAGKIPKQPPLSKIIWNKNQMVKTKHRLSTNCSIRIHWLKMVGLTTTKEHFKTIDKINFSWLHWLCPLKLLCSDFKPTLDLRGRLNFVRLGIQKQRSKTKSCLHSVNEEILSSLLSAPMIGSHNHYQHNELAISGI